MSDGCTDKSIPCNIATNIILRYADDNTGTNTSTTPLVTSEYFSSSTDGKETWSSWILFKGPKGDDGDSIVGAQGIQGIQGIQGEQGFQGNTGIQGQTGATGLTGDTGSQGIQGERGYRGYTGLTGLTGSQGIQGIQGPIGLTGATGAAGLGTNQLGFEEALVIVTLTANAIGDAWTTSTNGVDSQGNPVIISDVLRAIDTLTPSTFVNIGPIVGPAGADGAAGIQGIQGPAGMDGTNGTNGTDGTNGIDGQDGAQGIQGLTGPEGPSAVSGELPNAASISSVDNLIRVNQGIGSGLDTDLIRGIDSDYYRGLAELDASGDPDTFSVGIKLCSHSNNPTATWYYIDTVIGDEDNDSTVFKRNQWATTLNSVNSEKYFRIVNDNTLTYGPWVKILTSTNFGKTEIEALGLVPYTGATLDVDLGLNQLTAAKLFAEFTGNGILGGVKSTNGSPDYLIESAVTGLARLIFGATLGKGNGAGYVSYSDNDGSIMLGTNGTGRVRINEDGSVDVFNVPTKATAATKFITQDGDTLASRTITEVKSDLSLNNVDNVSDLNKPISTATQTALNNKAAQSEVDLNTAHRGIVNGGNPHGTKFDELVDIPYYVSQNVFSAKRLSYCTDPGQGSGTLTFPCNAILPDVPDKFKLQLSTSTESIRDNSGLKCTLSNNEISIGLDSTASIHYDIDCYVETARCHVYLMLDRKGVESIIPGSISRIEINNTTSEIRNASKTIEPFDLQKEDIITLRVTSGPGAVTAQLVQFETNVTIKNM